MYSLKEEFEEPEPLASVVKRLGNPESTTMLHSPCSVFQIPEVDGVICYQQVKNCYVAIGDPVCLPQDSARLTKAFHDHCHNRKVKIVYLLVYYDFAYWAIKNGCHTLIQVGEELSINPITFKKRQKLRWKINQSSQQGVQVQEYKNFNPAIEYQMKKTIQTWLQERKGLQIHLGAINFFGNRDFNRIFYAQHKDKIIGLLLLSPVDRYGGWVVSSYLALLDSPVGTTENLLCSTFDCLAHENCSFLCLGAVSGPHLGEAIGLSPLSKVCADLVFKFARLCFKLDAKAVYLKKYQPQMRPTFLLCKDKLTLTELLAIKHILNVKL